MHSAKPRHQTPVPRPMSLFPSGIVPPYFLDFCDLEDYKLFRHLFWRSPSTGGLLPKREVSGVSWRCPPGSVFGAGEPQKHSPSLPGAPRSGAGGAACDHLIRVGSALFLPAL